MTIKIFGSAINKEFVCCDTCHKKFVWLNAYKHYQHNTYYVRCRECRKRLVKEGKIWCKKSK